MGRTLESILPLTDQEFLQIKGYCESLAKEPCAHYGEYFIPLHEMSLRLLKSPKTALNPQDTPEIKELYCPRTDLRMYHQREVFSETLDVIIGGFTYELELHRGCQSAKGLSLDPHKKLFHALVDCARSWMDFVTEMEPSRFALLCDGKIVSQHDYAPLFLDK